MTVTRVQAIRSAVAGVRPTGRPPGEIYTNWPDNQLGVVDAAGVAVDLLAIRNFSTSASYIVGNYVVRSGQLYQAIAPTGPGAFVPGSWSAVTSASVPSLPWFDTRALAAAAVIPAGPQALMTAGYTTAGDGGGELYYRVAGTTTGGFQSADGAWWALEGASKTRFWSDVDNGAAITTPRVMVHRERLFLGAAVDYPNTALSGNPTYGWLSKATGANWIPRDSSIAVVSEYGTIGVSGCSRASDGSSGGAIGIAGFGVADVDGSTGHIAWGGYFEAIRQHPATTALGLEIDVRNCAAGAVAPQPWNLGSGPHGLWVLSGPGSGAGGYGPAPINHSGAAFAAGCNDAGGNIFRFQTGLLFTQDALTGSNGTDGEATSAAAISLARGHGIRWFASNGQSKLTFGSQLNTTDPDWAMYWLGNSAIFSRNGATEDVLRITGTAGAVNYFRIQNAVAGGAPVLSVTGADADVDMALAPMGNGKVRFGAVTTKAAEAFTSYLTIKDAAGNLRKLMVCA